MECCVIGSLNEAKIRGARRALSLLGISDVKPVKIVTMNPQPIGLDEILNGAAIRALKAREKYPDCYGLGVEAGIMIIDNYYFSGQIAVFTDGEKYSIGTSMFFPLPQSIGSEIVEKGVELKVLMIREAGLENIASSIGAVGHYTQGFITRTDLSYQAVLSAIIPWLNPEEYSDTLQPISKLLSRKPL